MKKIAVLLIGLLAIGMVSALLVTYLSNKAVAKVDVSSPISVTIVGENSIDVYGGETASLNIETKNLANVSITGVVKNSVYNSLGLNCSDFTSVVVSTTTDDVYVGTWDLIALGKCSVVNATTVDFEFGPQPNTWSAEQLDEMELLITFPSNAFGRYKLTSQILI